MKLKGISMLIALAFVAFGFSFVTASAAEAVLEAETTLALCSDGLDNDDNGATDLGDVNCAPFAEVENPPATPEDTAVLCADGLDNDDDGSVDLADTDCAAFVTPEDNGGNNGGDNDPDDDDDDNGSSGRSGQKKRTSSSSSDSDGEVLGAFTGSCPLITGYMRMGWANDAEEVKKLQEFLNEELDISLPVTGYYGELTQNAVNAFQLKYKEQVLQPWVDAGLHESAEVPTGFVYITTAHMINSIVCPDFDEELPALVPAGN